MPALSIAKWVLSSAIAHVSVSPPAIPDSRISRIRFWPRFCTPFSGCMPSHRTRALSTGLHTARRPMVCLHPRPDTHPHRDPGSASGDERRSQDHRVPRAPLLGPGVTWSKAAFNRASAGITPPSSLIRAHAPVLQPLPPFGFLMKEVFAGCCQPLLVIGPSRHYLCNPCAGARTLTPPCSSSAHAHFFPEDTGLTSRETRSAHETIPAMRLLQGAVISGLQSFDNLQAPALARPPDRTHRSMHSMLGGQAVYTTHRPSGYPTRDVVLLRARHGQLTRLDLHQLDCSLVGCSLPHTALQLVVHRRADRLTKPRDAAESIPRMTWRQIALSPPLQR